MTKYDQTKQVNFSLEKENESAEVFLTLIKKSFNINLSTKLDESKFLYYKKINIKIIVELFIFLKNFVIL